MPCIHRTAEGHRKVRRWVAPRWALDLLDSDVRGGVLGELGDGRVGLAVDVPPHAPIGHVLALLDEAVAAGVWEYDQGQRGHP